MKPSVVSGPSKAEGEDGVVVVDGPDGVALSLTPDSARELAEHLLAAADEADAQRRATAKMPVEG